MDIIINWGLVSVALVGPLGICENNILVNNDFEYQLHDESTCLDEEDPDDASLFFYELTCVINPFNSCIYSNW